jgi:hypothetical protein
VTKGCKQHVVLHQFPNQPRKAQHLLYEKGYQDIRDEGIEDPQAAKAALREPVAAVGTVRTIMTPDMPPAFFRLQDRSSDGHTPTNGPWVESDPTRVMPPIRVGDWVNYLGPQDVASANDANHGMRGKVVAVQGESASVRWLDRVNGLHRPINVSTHNLTPTRK